MKKMNLAKCVVVLVITFVASLSTYAAKMNNDLIYNAQEVNGLKVAETVYKKDGNMLTNYMKYSYKYNDNNQMTENMSQKWNVNKKLLGKRFVYSLYIRQQECNYRILQMEFQEE